MCCPPSGNRVSEHMPVGSSLSTERAAVNVDPLQPEDVADAIVWAATRPAHVSVQTVVMTPTAQANPFVLTRKS